jgi:nitrite reductase/ring-hydroxylating ferredoxin subunit
MPFVRAAKIAEVPAGAIHEFQVAGKAVAVANVAGKFYAISDVCVHRGGPLGQGELHDTVVTCPWHGWQYDVTTGKVTQNPTMGVACYATEVRGDELFVDIA